MVNNKSEDKVAKILRTDKTVILKMADFMEKKFGKKMVLEKIMAENDRKVDELLDELGLTRESKALEIHKAIIEKLKKDDEELFKILGKPDCEESETCNRTVELAMEITNDTKGFFLKGDKAKEILCKNPPPNILQAFGYSSCEKLLERENYKEVYAALRFVESRDWMNNVFTKSYLDLKPDDFEHREEEVIIMPKKWLKIAEKFIEKKYHNLSHLKELGVVFIIPIKADVLGETMRMFTLLLHYLNEVPFYSKLIEKHIDNNFGKNLVSLIRGDVLSGELPFGFWRIVQRYLAKDDVNDFRLFEPHVNPETIHWDKAEESLAKLDEKFPDMQLGFWESLNYVGDFFKNDLEDDLISFNLIDNVMGLAMKKEMIKYLYHHQEALWNRIFEEYVGGRSEMEKMIVKDFDRGYIEL